MLHVAIVDDDPDMRSLVRRWVTKDGHRVVAEAAHGAEGIDVAGTYRPDVLVLDVEMPVLDGCYAIPGILRASPGTVIVVFSSCVQRRDEALAAGAHTWVTKAADPHDLRDAIRQIAGGGTP